ncbi:MAG: thioredoxin family protein [Candidatus Cloacimonadales bacterium]
MKKLTIILTVILLLAVSFSCAQEKSKADAKGKTAEIKVKWIEDYDLALRTAAKENKVVLINFTGSDWCGWCKKLVSEVFSQPEFATYAEKNLVLLMLDFPTTFKQLPVETQQERQKLQEKYKVKGYPTILLTDSLGAVIAQTGYQDGGAIKYVEHLKGLIAKK